MTPTTPAANEFERLNGHRFTVYDANGTAFDLERPDALEYLKSGAYFEQPPKAAQPTGKVKA